MNFLIESEDANRGPVRCNMERKHCIMSIIDSKYAAKYRGDGDWVAQFIKGNCFFQKLKTVETKDDEGNVTGEESVNDGKPTLDVNALFAIAESNGIDATAKYGDQRERKNAPGRLRMTIGNSLRAIARRRHGLYDSDKNWHAAPEGFAEGEPIETPEGEKIRHEEAA